MGILYGLIGFFNQDRILICGVINEHNTTGTSRSRQDCGSDYNIRNRHYRTNQEK